MDVSVIIVNYNTCVLTRNCLNSIYQQTKDIDFEVIVSDNGSKDGSIEMIKKEFPQVILIENNANLGFGAANNRGLKIAKGKYIFYLNSDTVLLNNAIKFFFDYWEQSQEKDKIGALGANLLNDKGEIIHSGGKFPKAWKEVFFLSARLLITYIVWMFGIKKRRTKKKLVSEISDNVDYITGADLFVKNNKYAFFDERFFLYYEETYLQLQLNHIGLKRIIIKGPKIIHLEGESNSQKICGVLSDYVTFSAIQFEISRIKYQEFSGATFSAKIMKRLLYAFWSIPCFKQATEKYKLILLDNKK